MLVCMYMCMYIGMYVIICYVFVDPSPQPPQPANPFCPSAADRGWEVGGGLGCTRKLIH